MTINQESSEMDCQMKINGDQTRPKGHKLSLTSVCVDSKNLHAFTASKDGSIIKWCLETMRMVAKISPSMKNNDKSDKSLREKHHTKHINCMAISSDDKFLATGGWDKLIRIWSPKDLSWVHTFSNHRQEITALAFRIDHSTLYSGSADRAVMLWTLEDDDNRCYVESLYGHESSITSMDASRRERVLTSGGRDQSIRIWKIVEQAQTVYESKHESVDVVRLVDDKTFISGGEDGAISVWTTMKRSAVFSLKDAHKPNKVSGDKDDHIERFDQKGLMYWISALAALPLKTTVTRKVKVTKKRKLDLDGTEARYEDDHDDDDSDEGETNEGDHNEEGNESKKNNVLALVASGSCSSEVKIWKLLKSGSKYELKLHQCVTCPGFVNDLRFTSDGAKLIAACGQEHKFGRWWKIKGTKNCLSVFDVNKL